MMFQPAQFLTRDVEVIGPLSEEALGSRGRVGINLTAAASLTWVTNLAVFIPFGLSQSFLVREVWWGNGSAAGNNIDVGIYTPTGTRLASLGSTASGANSSIITSTTWTDYLLAPGDYYMAFTCSSTTNDCYGWVPAANIAASFGVGEMAAALPLPDPATIVPLTNAVVPYFGLNGFTVNV